MCRIAVVTGTASGIGKEIATRLVEMGNQVHGIDLKASRISGVIDHICDISDEDAVQKTASEIVGYEIGETVDMDRNLRETQRAERHQLKLDYIIHAAGIISVKRCYTLTDLPVKEWKRVIDVNLNGTFYVIRSLLPYIKFGGCMLNFSTEQVIKPNMKSAPYAVSKAGIEMLTKITALNVLDRCIRVNTIALGSVRTNFIRHMVESDAALEEKMIKADENMPLGLITTADVWNTVRYVLFNADKLTGQTILVDSGMTI